MNSQDKIPKTNIITSKPNPGEVHGSRLEGACRERLALVLSGGGSRGAYEAGVWQAMTELGMNIDIVTGTSVGAINGAMVCQGDLELTVSLWKETETHMIFDVPEGSQPYDYAKEIVTNKGAGSSGLRRLLTKYIDEDKIRRSPVEYGLVVVERENLKPHMLYKEDIPKGQLIDYIIAGASVYPAVHACEIDGREYIDGGYANVLPVDMAIKKNADKIIAVKLNAMGILRHDDLKKAQNLTIIESPWNLGSTLVFDLKNAKRIMRLGYLDAMKVFEVFDGNSYTFAASAFSKTDVKMADACARIFGMEPILIYTRDSFLKSLADFIRQAEMRRDSSLLQLKKILSSGFRISRIVEDLKNIANPQSLVFAIAEDLKEKNANSLFLTRSAVKLLPEQILAARFLVKYRLI